MSKLTDLSGMLQETLSAWQFFRQLGYTSEQIFVGVDGEKVVVQVQWRDLTYNLAVDRTTMTLTEWSTIWDHASETLAAATDSELDEMWYASKILQLSPLVLTNMEEAGIYWPKHDDFKDLN
jgi:hypothetical protein